MKDSSGKKGILTAKHCAQNWPGDTVSYNGTVLPNQRGAYGGSRDVMWATAPGFTVRNLAFDGTGNRYVYSTKSRSQQSEDEYVCKYGITTGYNCGYIESKNYARPTAPCTGGCTWSATWILVEREGVNLADPGDSGGPWFLGNKAYGVMTAKLGEKAVYMAINYIDALGVTVLTE